MMIVNHKIVKINMNKKNKIVNKEIEMIVNAQFFDNI